MPPKQQSNKKHVKTSEDIVCLILALRPPVDTVLSDRNKNAIPQYF